MKNVQPASMRFQLRSLQYPYQVLEHYPGLASSEYEIHLVNQGVNPHTETYIDLPNLQAMANLPFLLGKRVILETEDVEMGCSEANPVITILDDYMG